MARLRGGRLRIEQVYDEINEPMRVSWLIFRRIDGTRLVTSKACRTAQVLPPES
jgi:hypothetical protein